MKGHIVSSAEAAAYGAKLSAVDIVCNYPTYFSTSISNGLKDLPVIESDSFSSALNVAMGSELGGKRAFIASSVPISEDIHTTSYMRLPVVISNISRPPGTFSIKHDNTDVFSMRDAGWLIFMPESNQEIIDSIIQAYKVCEDSKVLLPAVINIDISHYQEPVQMPSDKFTKRYVSKFKIPFQINGKKQYFGVPDQDHDVFKQQQHRAMKNALDIIEKTSIAWKKKTKRVLDLVESYKIEDADYVLIISGFHSTTAKAAIDKMRADGKKVGLLRIRVVRPWPSDAIKNALKDVKRVAVFDQNISLGQHGILYNEIIKYTEGTNFISLGKYPSENDFIGVLTRLIKAEKEELVWL